MVKGDSLLLLDDANSYWWLVRVLKTEDVGYIPAENVETPYERLARLNKHRNIDVAAATDREKADADAREQKRRDNKLKSLIGWPRRGSSQPQPAATDIFDDDPEQREGRRVGFGPLTYVDHPGVTWSSDEEDEDDEDDEDAHDADNEDEDEVNMDRHIDEQLGYDVEPDDGVEWAQDAVEAMRNAEGNSSIEMHDSDMAPEDHSHSLDQAEVIGGGHTVPQSAIGAGAAAAAAVAAGAAGTAGLLAVNSAAGDVRAGAPLAVDAPVTPSDAAGTPSDSPEAEVPGAFPPAPDRSPSPSASPVHGLAARALPTPPPHRAPQPSPSTVEASPEPPTREMTPATPPPASTAPVQALSTPASSDMHAEATTPPKGHEPTASVASAASAFSTTSGDTAMQTPLRSSEQSLASSYSTPTGASPGTLAVGAGAAAAAATAAAGGVAVHTVTTPTSPTGTTPASPATAGPPVSFPVRAPEQPTTRSPAPTQAQRAAAPVPPLWYTDAFDISRLATLVRARATDIKRNTPVPRPRKPTEPVDDVQRMLYGDRPEMDHLPLDLRAPFVHLQAKMDAFDREIDDLLGSLVAAH